jgi:hypothetical protein
MEFLKLNGHSGSEVYLVTDGDRKFVRKVWNVDRNYERLTALKELGFPVPSIYSYRDNTLDMEYIHGLDIRTYLTYNNSIPLTEFLLGILNRMEDGTKSDFTYTYGRWLEWFTGDHPFPFNREQLLEKLPKILPVTEYHGDLTLENIIYGNDGQFYLIDAVTGPFCSYVFDIAKLRQDLDCGWFIRKEPKLVMPELPAIKEAILRRYPIANDDYLLILMLLRVYRHCRKETLEYDFIVRKVNELWK